MKKTFACLFSVMCVLSVFFSSLLPVTAEEEPTCLTIEYMSTTTGKMISFEAPYDDAWFREDARTYSHPLAQGSLGLMAASFRPYPEEEVEYPYIRAEKYLKETGFTDLRFDDYDRPAGRYTVSSAMGRKTLEDEEGPFTLIAIGIAGQGYQGEWLSNLAIGGGDMHEGFREAADDIYDRFFGYIAQHKISGRIKVWMSGFSRSASIANLFAAQLDRENILPQSDVFVYTYAAPRVVKDPDSGSCSNIFNITGMMDPIPQIPFRDWEFERYGITFFTPSQETNSTWYEKQLKARDYYEEFVGLEFWNNPSIDITIKTLFEYLLEICPDNETYAEHLQERLQRMWTSKTVFDLLKVLVEISQDKELITKENAAEANSLLDFALYTFIDYLTSSKRFGYYEDGASIGGNLIHEHTPELYISWMMTSDSPEELFSDNTEFTWVIISGNVKAEVFDLKSGERIQETDESGEILYYSDSIRLYAVQEDDQTALIFPKDMSYQLNIIPNEDGTITVNTVDYTSEQTWITQYNSSEFDAVKGEAITLEYGRKNWNDTASGDASWDHSEFPFIKGTLSKIKAYEKLNVFHLNWRDFTVLVIAVASIVIALAVFLLTYAIGNTRLLYGKVHGIYSQDTKYHTLPAFCLSFIYVFFLTTEFVTALFPNYPYFKTINKAIIGVLLIFVCGCGYQYNKSALNKWNLHAMILFTAADLIINYQLSVGLVIRTIAILSLCNGLYRERTPMDWQWFLFTFLVVISLWFLTPFDLSSLMTILFAAHLAASILLFAFAFPAPSRFRNGAWLLLLSGILLVFDRLEISTFVSHLFSAGIYYTALILFAAGSIKLIKLIPENSSETASSEESSEASAV